VVRRSVPQLTVLSKASLFISRAGMNSVNESLFHGVPMLLFPATSEQELVAQQVSDLGAGLVLNERMRAPQLWREAERILREPSFHEAAKQLGSSLREAGGPARAAEVVLQFRAQALTRTSAACG
jgi:MGT family glycosyltransferase